MKGKGPATPAGLLSWGFQPTLSQPPCPSRPRAWDTWSWTAVPPALTAGRGMEFLSGSQLLRKMVAWPQAPGLASVSLGGSAGVCGGCHQPRGSAGQSLSAATEAIRV